MSRAGLAGNRMLLGYALGPTTVSCRARHGVLSLICAFPYHVLGRCGNG
jgi:hypothetical protein